MAEGATDIYVAERERGGGTCAFLVVDARLGRLRQLTSLAASCNLYRSLLGMWTKALDRNGFSVYSCRHCSSTNVAEAHVR